MSLIATVIRKIGRYYVKPFAVVGASTPILGRLNPILEIITGRLAPLGDILYERERIEGIRCERTTPTDHTDLTIIYFHGGGFQFGSPKGHRNLTTRLALDTRAQIISVDYTLGAYGPAEREAERVVKSILDTPGRYMVAGDSAGGNLAFHIGHLYGHKLEAVIGISPWVDLTKQTKGDRDPLISAIAINAAARRYLQGAHPKYASKYDCSDSMLTETTTILHYCDDEILARGIDKLVDNLVYAGKIPKIRSYKGLFHVFQILGGIIPEADDAVRDLANDIKSVYNGNSTETI
jgi:triacylglycerol lipase